MATESRLLFEHMQKLGCDSLSLFLHLCFSPELSATDAVSHRYFCQLPFDPSRTEIGPLPSTFAQTSLGQLTPFSRTYRMPTHRAGDGHAAGGVATTCVKHSLFMTKPVRDERPDGNFDGP